MSKKVVLLEIDNSNITVKLYWNLLKIDLKGNLKNEFEEALENKPVLKETIGSLLGIFIPLHIPLVNIHSVRMDETGKVKLSVAHHRNITIPLERENGKKLVKILNQLIPKKREKN